MLHEDEQTNSPTMSKQYPIYTANDIRLLNNEKDNNIDASNNNRIYIK